MKTLGVDLAAATKKTAVAVLEWDSGAARLEHLALDVGDTEIVQLFGSSSMTGIDCPVGRPAMRCAVIQAKIAAEYGPQARDGSGRLAEVYPAASLKTWGLLARGYKGGRAPEAERLGVVLDHLAAAAPWLDLAGHEDRLAASDDLFDAVIASLTARAVSLGQTLPPPQHHAAAALTEGWIHVPSGQLADLVGQSNAGSLSAR